MNTFSRLALALATSSMLTLAVTLPAQAAQHAAKHHASQELNATDRTFLTQLAQALAFEEQAGKLAQERGTRDVIKSLGKKDVAFTERLDRALQRLAEKKSVKLPEGLGDGHEAALAKLRREQGEAFDKAFVENAGSAHHYDLVEGFRRTAERSIDVDVRGFARTWLPQVNQRFTMVNSATADIAPEALKPSPDTAPRRDGPRTNMQSDERGRAKE